MSFLHVRRWQEELIINFTSSQWVVVLVVLSMKDGRTEALEAEDKEG